MNKKQPCLFLILVVTLQCFFKFPLGQQDEEPKRLYIVYMGEKKHKDPDVVTASHHDTLKSIFGSEENARKSIVYSYRHGFSGFAAMLTESQAKEVAEMPEVRSVRPNRHVPLHTTRSWDFLGLNYNQPEGLLRETNYGDGIIIGIIDSGIWPESKSFEDTGCGPIPSRWQGICQVGESNKTYCNRKIIGNRMYNDEVPKEWLKEDFLSPRDLGGHGTHTASIAAGNLVANVSDLGGEVRGGAPRARLAIYKACWGKTGGCSSAGIVKAIDHAIHDGVDIISLSVSMGMLEFPYATLHAVLEGKTVVVSGGNDGPQPQSITNDAPWILTVAASTIDRSFPTVITLGNNRTLVGQSLFPALEHVNNFTQLVHGAGCDAQTLNNTDFIGKVVICFPDPENSTGTPPALHLSKAVLNALKAGARGFIFAGYGLSGIEAIEQQKPCVAIDSEALMQILRYVNTADDPVVKVAPSRTVIGSEVLAPKVADFSSRGPSASFPGLIKPDITAPGVSILAAQPSGYDLASGTSMSCPHVAGVAALLKSLHPDWSPAAIKSALITTASINDAYGVPIEAQSTPPKIADPFDFGGGHIDPNRAADPGLIYDINPKDYFQYFECNKLEICRQTEAPQYDLNLPSISIPDLTSTTKVQRTVTNIGKDSAVYKAIVQAPPGVKMTVEPSVLHFTKSKKTNKFTVTFNALRKVRGDFNFGSLTWVEVYGPHSVRIPIAVRTVLETCPA